MNAHCNIPADRIGRFAIERRIGEGAMANVALAQDPSIGRAVAIKTLKPEFCQEGEIVRRFLDESRAAGRLSHAHIVTIYDVGEAEGVPYIAMEYVDGLPLDQLLGTEGRLGLERALRLGAQIASALSYAHGRGVVHRDIKPSNILVCAQGQTAKLLDFGIARIDSRDEEHAERDAQRTQVGQVMGTPRYMSPEQALGLAVDARSDLFALGSVLYEMLTGKPAFAGTAVATLAIQITQDKPVAVETMVPGCPDGVLAILTSLMAKKPDERFADAGAAHRALLREIEALTSEPETRRRGLALSVRMPLVFAGASALALVASSGIVLFRQNATMEQMAAHAAHSMADFVARNAALRVAENAGLAREEQDWLPLQAFAETAAQDRSVLRLIIADDQHVIRAASDKALLGKVHRTLPDQTGLVVEPIRYGGASFGTVEMIFDRQPIEAARAEGRKWMIGLSLFVTALLGLVGYMSAQSLLRPLRRLRKAMEALADGEKGVRLTARRRDEFAPLFDMFNRLSVEVENRAEPDNLQDAMAMTRVERFEREAA
ncbi:serine/threonine-protein kinase [Sphingobium phenoxybenzoativorans]|uniref:serine/threonine-protein kinase n=1 Tax=Sphingobium phenoxybenzoativorans TaxID=1592790 RepID=UPI00087266A8|nr:serine/threonine-protein kinase [Sphingobium phenoxybenzoativorans]